MDFKATIRSAATSYIGAISAVFTGLLSLRLATHYLSQEEFGLWSFTMQTVGYFMLLDLGVANSITRLLGDPLATKDQRKINSWFTLSVVTLGLQALLIVGVGIAFRPFVLEWFNIPEHLRERASNLWLSFLLIQAVALVFKVSFAILHAQNRAYMTSTVQVIGSWVGLGTFFWMASLGWGVMSYAFSSGASVLFISLGGVLAVWRGKHRFGFSLYGINKHQISRMFGFSSSIFVIGLAIQVYFASQTLIATKILGLEAGAVLTVTGRAAGIATGMIWRPFDAFAPRWQVAYCASDYDRVTREFRLMSRFTIMLSVAAAVAMVLMNQPFVLWWTKPGYFGGQILTNLMAVFVIIQAIDRCFVSPFVLAVKMRGYTIVTLLSVACAICLMFTLTKWMGLIGIPPGLIITDLAFPVWYYMIKGGAKISVSGLHVIWEDLAYMAPAALAAVLVSLGLERISIHTNWLWLIIATGCAIVICAPLLWRAFSLLRKLKNPDITEQSLTSP